MAGCNCKDGERGPMGPQGEKGDTGATGPAGLQGEPGLQGPQGLPGDKGDTGPQGDQGPQGPAGAQGPAGPTGATGAAGAAGPAGATGPAGTNGTNGANGQGRLSYSTDSSAITHTLSPVANSGHFMENTGFATVNLPLGAALGDVVEIIGTIDCTGGWKIECLVGQSIEMTHQANALVTTTGVGGEIIIASTNYGDVMRFVCMGGDRWIINNVVFANGNIPLFI